MSEHNVLSSEELDFIRQIFSSQLIGKPLHTSAVKVEGGGRSLVFSGDTGESDALVDISRGADLALYEASFLERYENLPPNLHLTAKQASEHAMKAGVQRLVLTHLVPWTPREETQAEAEAVYDGDLVLAEQGMVLEV